MEEYRTVTTEAYFAEPQFRGNFGAIIICAQLAEKRTKHDLEARYMRIPMKADTCSDSYRTLIRRYRTVVGAKRRSSVSNKELSDMRQENRA